MTTPLRCLIVEDSEDDARLMVRQLSKGGYDVMWERVETAEAMRAAFNRQRWDVVLADYKLPHFSGPAALELLKAGGQDLPFLIVSGTIGEEQAVAAMKAGAHDYVMKDRPGRLVPAVERELREAAGRRERRRDEEAWRTLSARQEAILAAVPDVIMEVDKHQVYTWANQAGLAFFGDDVIGKEAAFYFEGEQSTYQSVQPLFSGHQDLIYVESWQRRKDGERRLLAWWCRVLKDESGHVTGALSSGRDITEETRTEAALRESEARYRALFSEGADGILIADIETKTFKFANPALCRMLGYTEDELRTMGVTDIHPKDALQSVVAEFEAQVRGERTLAADIPCLRKDGSVVHVDVSAFKITIDGRLCNVGIFRDITERKQAEEAARASQSLLRATLESTADGILVVGADGKVLDWNEQFQKMWRLPQSVVDTRRDQELLDHVLEQLARPDDFLAGVRALYAQPDKESFDTLQFKDGRVFERYSRPQRIGERIVGRVWSFRDVTERILAEARNRELALLLDNATDAIYVTALDCTILYWNRGAGRTYGWTSAEALNRKTTELLAADPAAAAALSAVLLKQESWSGERWQKTKDGRKVEVLTRLTLVRNEQGQPQSIFAINTDITEKKKLEDQFLRAQRLESIGVLASGIAHDLNNVLAPIIMGAPLLRDKVKDEASNDLLETIESSARRGAAVVKQVLTFARGVEGERVPLQPRHLVQEVARLAEETFSKTIRIESDVTADLWAVLGDATQLHQALLNLCVNARDAMPGGGVLTLKAANVVLSKEAAEKIPGAQPGSYACLCVTDTGTGIPPEIEAKMFEPFFTTKSLGKGTGLGLSTVLGVVRSHGGFIRVASKVGQGTTFELYLPATTTGQGADKSESAARWPLGHGEGILVVDDEAAVREVARRTLAKFGYRVITAAHGAEALRIFQERRPEIQAVLTDMMMPEMDGAALIAALRALDPAVRIVGVTGMSDMESMRGYRSLGLSGMLAKPFTIETLLAAVQAALPVTAGGGSVPAGGKSGSAPPG